MAPTFESVADYLAAQPEGNREVLDRVRRMILRLVPDSAERISYQMPMVSMAGRPLVHVAGWKKHIGLYPIPVAGPELESRIAPLRSGKDSVRLPLTRPLDDDLLAAIVEFLVARRLAEDDGAR